MVVYHLIFLSVLSMAFTAYVSKNKLVKSGVCPKQTGGYSTVCGSGCTNDNDCPGTKKCCRIGSCATYSCTRPVFIEIDTSRSSTMLNTRESSVIGIRGSHGGEETLNMVSSRRFADGGVGSKRVSHAVGGTGEASVGRVVSGGSQPILETVAIGTRSGQSAGSSSHRSGSKRISHLSGFEETSRHETFVDGSASGTSVLTTGHLSGGDGATSNCRYECGRGKHCAKGYMCVQDGCHSVCKLSTGSGIGHGISGQGRSRSVDRSVGTDGQIHSESMGTSRGMSGHATFEIVDGVSGRSGGSIRSRGQTVVGSRSQTAVGGDCRKQCYSDADCTHQKSCVTVGCHMMCRRRRVTNHYKP